MLLLPSSKGWKIILLCHSQMSNFNISPNCSPLYRACLSFPLLSIFYPAWSSLALWFIRLLHGYRSTSSGIAQPLLRHSRPASGQEVYNSHCPLVRIVFDLTTARDIHEQINTTIFEYSRWYLLARRKVSRLSTTLRSSPSMPSTKKTRYVKACVISRHVSK